MTAMFALMLERKILFFLVLFYSTESRFHSRARYQYWTWGFLWTFFFLEGLFLWSLSYFFLMLDCFWLYWLGGCLLVLTEPKFVNLILLFRSNSRINFHMLRDVFLFLIWLSGCCFSPLFLFPQKGNRIMQLMLFNPAISLLHRASLLGFFLTIIFFLLFLWLFSFFQRLSPWHLLILPSLWVHCISFSDIFFFTFGWVVDDILMFLLTGKKTIVKIALLFFYRRRFIPCSLFIIIFWCQLWKITASFWYNLTVDYIVTISSLRVAFIGWMLPFAVALPIKKLRIDVRRSVGLLTFTLAVFIVVEKFYLFRLHNWADLSLMLLQLILNMAYSCFYFVNIWLISIRFLRHHIFWLTLPISDTS